MRDPSHYNSVSTCESISIFPACIPANSAEGGPRRIRRFPVFASPPTKPLRTGISGQSAVGSHLQARADAFDDQITSSQESVANKPSWHSWQPGDFETPDSWSAAREISVQFLARRRLAATG